MNRPQKDNTQNVFNNKYKKGTYQGKYNNLILLSKIHLCIKITNVQFYFNTGIESNQIMNSYSKFRQNQSSDDYQKQQKRIEQQQGINEYNQKLSDEKKEMCFRKAFQSQQAVDLLQEIELQKETQKQKNREHYQSLAKQIEDNKQKKLIQLSREHQENQRAEEKLQKSIIEEKQIVEIDPYRHGRRRAVSKQLKNSELERITDSTSVVLRSIQTPSQGQEEFDKSQRQSQSEQKYPLTERQQQKDLQYSNGIQDLKQLMLFNETQIKQQIIDIVDFTSQTNRLKEQYTKLSTNLSPYLTTPGGFAAKEIVDYQFDKQDIFYHDDKIQSNETDSKSQNEFLEREINNTSQFFPGINRIYDLKGQNNEHHTTPSFEIRYLPLELKEQEFQQRQKTPISPMHETFTDYHKILMDNNFRLNNMEA